jgi:hypothetical protein
VDYLCVYALCEDLGMRVDHAAKAGEGSFKHCFKQRKNATLDEAALPTLMLAHVSKGHIAQAPCYILHK